jgi:hypothetical protein
MPPLDQWFLLEWEFSDDPSSIRMWVNGEKCTMPRREERLDVVKFVWPKDSTNDKGIVGGYTEFGVGARPCRASTFITTIYRSLRSAPRTSYLLP